MSEHIIFQSGLFDAEVRVVLFTVMSMRSFANKSKGTNIMMNRDNVHSDNFSSLTQAIGIVNYLYFKSTS